MAAFPAGSTPPPARLRALWFISTAAASSSAGSKSHHDVCGDPDRGSYLTHANAQMPTRGEVLYYARTCYEGEEEPMDDITATPLWTPSFAGLPPNETRSPMMPAPMQASSMPRADRRSSPDYS